MINPLQFPLIKGTKWMFYNWNWYKSSLRCSYGLFQLLQKNHQHRENHSNTGDTDIQKKNTTRDDYGKVLPDHDKSCQQEGIIEANNDSCRPNRNGYDHETME